MKKYAVFVVRAVIMRKNVVPVFLDLRKSFQFLFDPFIVGVDCVDLLSIDVVKEMFFKLIHKTLNLD